MFTFAIAERLGERFLVLLVRVLLVRDLLVRVLLVRDLLVGVLLVRDLLVHVLLVCDLLVRMLLVPVLLVQSSPVQSSPVQSSTYSMPRFSAQRTRQINCKLVPISDRQARDIYFVSLRRQHSDRMFLTARRFADRPLLGANKRVGNEENNSPMVAGAPSPLLSCALRLRIIPRFPSPFNTCHAGFIFILNLQSTCPLSYDKS